MDQETAQQEAEATTSTTPAFQSNIDYEALGNRLRAFRIGASMLADDVAARLGVSRAVVYRMEKGEIVKIETLERLAELLGSSLASLLGVEVEYYPTVLGLLERMRQLELVSDRILSHFEPVSLLLTSDDYLPYLKLMLQEASPGADKKASAVELDEMLRLMAERKAFFEKRRPHIVSLIGMRELERFAHTGLVGRVDLPENVRVERVQAARREVQRIAELMDSEPFDVQIGLIDDSMPASTFQVFSGPQQAVLAVSPFRFGELPNVRNGIASVTAAAEPVRMYNDMIGKLWQSAYKGKDGAKHLRKMLDRVG
ncbi:hypothetical protein BH09PSE5_BH09PSE5_12730 [soil metagenome]